MVLTKAHRTANAMRFKHSTQDNIWVALGGTSPWPDEQHPPAPSLTTTTIDTPVLYVKAIVRYVKEDPAGGFVFVDPSGVQRYFLEITNESQVISQLISVVMVQATANGIDIPATTIREIGFVTNLVPAAGFEGRSQLTPQQITSTGILETIEYRVPLAIIDTSTYSFSYLTEF
jgi:hypothetical protein